ncbi:MAG: winged helix-turn-helix domain-containing protein [Nitrososphaeria archaeon]
MIDITIISDITTFVALILSIIAISYIYRYNNRINDMEMINDVINLQNNKIADIAWKVDLMYKKTSPSNYTEPINEKIPIESNQKVALNVPIQQMVEHHINDLENLIINSLKDRELSSSEIQAVVGKTREHVSRTLKKMVDDGVLERDESHKPYKYRLVSRDNLE